MKTVKNAHKIDQVTLRVSMCLLMAFLLFAFQAKAQNSIRVYVSPPSQNTTNVVVVSPQVVTTMPFNTTGDNWAATSPLYTTMAGIGEYYKISGTSSVKGDDQYGSGDGTYLAIGEGGQVGLRFSEDKNYFGFAWCAGDIGNQIQVYHDAELLLTYTTANVIDFLPNSNKVITAIDASTHLSSEYYGKFYSKTTNSNEPYAYLHIYSTGNIVFNRLVFSQATPGSGAGTFENDNHSVVSGTLTTLPGTWTTVYEATAGTAASDQTICYGYSPSGLTLTGSVGTIQWQVSTNNTTWSDISGASSASLSAAQIGILTSTRYYRAAVSSGTTSAYSNTITITITPSSFTPPVKTLANLSVTGTNIKWYAASSGGSELPSSTSITATGTTYYASQTINSVESTARLAVTARVDPTPCAPTGDATQTRTSGQTLANLTVSGSNIRWYSASTGGDLLDPSTALVNGMQYFATQTVSCTESATRLSVTVTIN
jgi:hypothetical protein